MEAFCSPSPAPQPLTLDRLRNLIRISQRSALRLKSAANAAGDRVLRRRLDEFAALRQAHAEELEARTSDEAQALPASSYDEAAALLAQPVATELDDRADLLTEIERGEAVACRAYARAIDRCEPGEALQRMLSRQLAETRRSQSIFIDLRDLMLED